MYLKASTIDIIAYKTGLETDDITYLTRTQKWMAMLKCLLHLYRCDAPLCSSQDKQVVVFTEIVL